MALALLGGTILNLMPCVFPVLSLKALSLANSTSAASTRRHGWSYTAGSVATFTLIAALLYSARSAGEAVGWGFQLQSPLVIGILVYLFFTMGLSLSNILQLRTPWTNLGNDLTRGHSLKASFFTGALASVVASPCTAPFMGAALGFAMTQSPATGLLVFAALGLGMALPLLLLSHLPQLHRHLPKPGPWMESLKQILAFPLFFTAVWLLWVLGHQAGTDALTKLLGGLTLLALGAWLLRPERNPRTKRWRHALSLGAALAALSLLPGTSAAPANPAASGSDWQPYSRARLDELRAAGEPVFINLTADWCITCKANEKFALNTAAVSAAFEDAGIHRLKGDWTNPDAEISALLTEFDRSGVPLYLFYPAGSTRPAKILPQLLTEKILLEQIRDAKTTK
jgi:thiol:disulfide interchange protein DsbD